MGQMGDAGAARRLLASRQTNAKEPRMTATVTTVDARLAGRLSEEFHRCFGRFEVRTDLFAQDSFFDLLPPYWRFQFVGPGKAFTNQLRSIAEGPADIDVVRTLPT